MSRWGAMIWLAAAATLLVGCSTPAPKPKAARVAVPTAAEGPMCVVDLSYAGVAFDRLPDTAKDGACGIATAISLVESPTPLSRPVTVECGLAHQLSRWDREVLEPLTQRMFGQSIRTIHHYGGYVCRNRRNSATRPSEHSFGRALDIGGFELTDGTSINVEKDWKEGGRKQEFLRQAAAGACPYFSVVLTPNSDRDHHNHFHFDVGPWKLCSL